MKEKIYKIKEEALKDMNKLKTMDQLEEMRVKFLGKKRGAY